MKTKHPVSEGFVALLEPFIDTVVICTMTALTIVIADVDMYGDLLDRAADGESVTSDTGVVLTSRSFDSFLPGFDNVLTVAVALFAFSPLITWSYYTLKAWTTLVGLVILGGVQSIAKVTSKLVPVMATIYIVACLAFLGGIRRGEITEVPVEERATP